jgi:polyisoprenoid-binding protein YceI
MKRILALLSVLALAAAAPLSAETFNIDTAHSSVGYSIRHLVSKFSSSFTKVSGTINYDAASPEASTVEATVDVAALTTANEKRDNHLKSSDFFDVAKFPSATFKSKSWKKTGTDTYDVTGDLTIKDVTKEVVLKTTLLATAPGNGGSTVTGWEATTTLKKADFNMAGPAGLIKVLGEDVTLTIGIEAKTPSKK